MVIINSAEGVSYAAILESLKSSVNPEKLVSSVRGIRKARSKDMLVQVKYAAKNWGRLDSTFRDVIRKRGFVYHLVSVAKVEIMDLDYTAEETEVEKVVKTCLHEEPTSELKVIMTRKPFRGSRKAFIKLK